MSHLVSVITPVYNAVFFLEETVRSVLSQGWQNLELLLIDDCSTDGSRELIEKLACSDSRIKPLLLDTNGGPARARNQGIAHARGEFIAFVDADDLWLPDKLSEQFKIFEGNPHLGLVSGNGRLIDSSSTVGEFLFPAHKAFAGSISLADYLLVGLPIVTSSVVVRKACLDSCGLFKETYPVGEDFELWMRIVESFEVAVLDADHVRYRLHDNNSTRNKLRNRASKVAIYENEVLPRADSLGAAREAALSKLQRMYCSLGKLYLEDCAVVPARECFQKALSLKMSLVTAKACFYWFLSLLAKEDKTYVNSKNTQ